MGSTTARPGGDGTVTWRQLLAETEGLLGERPAARWICEEASGLDGAELLGALDEPATERMVHHLDAMVARVRGGEPLQYVLGRWGFRHLDLLVDRRVLIPRPETELLVERAIAAMVDRSRPLLVADLGTGSGAIGLSLAFELLHPGLEVWITDVSADALDVARANVAAIGRAGAVVRVGEGSWFEALPADGRGRFDLIVSNPPYIAVDDPAVEAQVRDWEPAGALFAGRDGLDDIRVIAAGAPEWLAPGGVLIVEIGFTQGAAACEILDARGYDDVQVVADLAGHDRFVQAKRAAT